MGAEQSTEETKIIETEIMNNTKVQNTVKKYNETINETMMSSIQTTATNASQTIKAEQALASDSSFTTDGGFNLEVSGSKQSADVKADFSSLAQTEIQQEVLQSTMNDLQNKMKKDLEAATASNAAQSTAEANPLNDMINAAADVLGGTAGALTGTDMSSKSHEERRTTIQNHLDISNTTEIENKVVNSVKMETINELIQTLSNQVIASQKVASGLDVDASKDINIALLDTEQIMTIETAMQIVTDSGTGSTIMSDLLNIEKTQVEDAIKTATEAETAND